MASWNPNWRRSNVLVLPVATLHDAIIEASVNIGEEESGSVSRRDRFGIRAAAYSLRLERVITSVSDVLYVTDEERDSLGYDIENTSVEPSRLIVSVGSPLPEVTHSVIGELHYRFERSRYEIQYWGLIDLTLAPKAEYLRLRQLDYPRLIEKSPKSAVDVV
jgi:hypothetical protein